MNGLGDRAKEVAIEHVKQKAARDILNGINEWRSNRISTAKRRWLFELIQNAIDTAKARKNNTLKIHINKNDNSITFKHNGGYFTLDEISAVIYGGSTKPYAPESEYIGRFGTGFLVTHIVSRKVKLTGFIKENEEKTYKFEININREGNDEKIISNDIEECFQQLNKSTQINSNEMELYTEFIYYLNDKLGREAVIVGIEELKRTIPFVITFNEIIQEITIENERFINQSEKRNFGQSNMSIEIEKDEKNEIVVGIAIKDSEVMELEKLPKIFVGMPLIETADYINLPFVIYSTKFEPTKERDALSSDSEKNKELLSRAFEIYKKLLRKISGQDNIKGLFRTVDIRLVSNEKISQNPLWAYFNENIEKVFTEIINEIPLVETFDGRRAINNTLFPTYGILGRLEDNLKNEVFVKFYNLTKQIKKNIPIENERENWRNISENLRKIGDFSKLISLYSIEEMRNELDNFVKKRESYPTFEDLAKNFQIENPKQFLHSLYEILDDLYQKEVISNSFLDFLLPNQMGIIGPLKLDSKPLYIEENIPEELKEIFQNIGWKIRDELLDKDFAKYKIVSNLVPNKMSTDNALDRVIKNKSLRPNEHDLKKDEWDERTKGWIDLFRWCIKNKKLIVGFPIINKDGKIQDVKHLDAEDLIIPFKCMGIDDKYENIYPDNRILHHKYFDDYDEILNGLKNYKTFIIELPIYENASTLGYSKLESILTEKHIVSKVDHKIESNEKNISILPFWNEVIGKISEYQDRGKLLFEFVCKYLISHDESWKKTIQVSCSCSDKYHEIIPSHWLASLKSDAWVPYKIIEDNKEKIVRREARKESIENLFTREEFDELIKSNSDRITLLLPHFGFDELDLKIRFFSIEKGKPEAEIRKKLSPFVRFIDILEDLIDIVLENAIKEEKRRKINDENQRIGKNVEKIITKILQDKGFTVRPIYKGGDLEIWPEEVGFDIGLIEIESYLLEVKFTSGKRVHLSRKQSEMAQSRRKNYLVLVVESANDLRNYLKEMDENSISDEIIKAVIKQSKIVEEIYTKLGVFSSSDEIEPDLHGYWLKEKLWKDKNNILNWIENEFGVG